MHTVASRTENGNTEPERRQRRSRIVTARGYLGFRLPKLRNYACEHASKCCCPERPFEQQHPQATTHTRNNTHKQQHTHKQRHTQQLTSTVGGSEIEFDFGLPVTPPPPPTHALDGRGTSVEVEARLAPKHRCSLTDPRNLAPAVCSPIWPICAAGGAPRAIRITRSVI